MGSHKIWFNGKELSIGTTENEEKDKTIEQKCTTENIFDTIIVSVIPEFGTMNQIILSGRPEGKYYFDTKDNSIIQESLYVQAYEGKWYLYSIKPVYLREKNGNYVSYVEITDQKLLSVRNVNEECIVYIEFLSKGAKKSHNYKVLDKIIEIGSSEDCDISYKNDKLTVVHAELQYADDIWEISCCNQDTFVLVNGKRCTKSVIQVGDIINLFGLKMIIGIGFLSINDCNERIKIKKEKLYKIDSTSDVGFFDISIHSEQKKELFNRMPRRRKPLQEKEIRIDSPPMQLNGEKIPLMLRMGSSMIMGTSSMLMGNYTTMINSVLFPVVNAKYTEKQRKEYESRRIDKYTEYLEMKEQEIEKERLEEEEILNYNYPDLESVLLFPEDGGRLWERRKSDDDFLTIRVGYGNTPLRVKYIYQEERFGLDEDVLEDKMYELVNRKRELKHVPIMNSFVDNFVCGILGSKNLTLSFVKRLLMQLVISHSYDEVKTIFLINEDDLKQLNFIRYIPHVWDDEKRFRFIATNTTEAFQISEHLKRELEDELEKKNVKLDDILKRRPYYVVFAVDKKLFDSVEVLKDVMQLEDNCGVSIITAFDELPKECFKIFQLNTDGDHAVVHLKELAQQDILFRFDYFDEKVSIESMKKIANTSLRECTKTYTLPKMITFLEMFGVGKIEHLNPLQRWKEHNAVKSLAVPVGIGTDGSLFELDLHQKYQGPHGLIAGMTGSGKSEFIITYILSLAINFHPDEVAFLLIDYKGGGLTSAFDDAKRGIHLPHLVGTITNLDGASINRALISIQSELTRRQRIFNEAKSKVDESNIDIYAYQQLYRKKQVEEPLPHLFIIADEFAEMKQQQPEFMESLISIARIGRSLGVHLILATQKPSGVVNDQIRSNTKFRVCLKVQDKADSMDMLKRPEGAELVETGRFYLQVGYNEYFALGQSAWTGADYEAQEQVVVKKDDSVVFVDITGQTICETKPETKRVSSGKSQLTEIVKYLSDLAKVENIKPRKLWKDALPEKISSVTESVEDIRKIFEKEKGGLSTFIGMVDDPVNQSQYPYFYNFMDCSNLLIVGESKSGKTTMIQNMLYRLTTFENAGDVNYYILDYSSHMLKLFKDAPHCGAVLTEDDETAVKPFFDLLERIADDRKKLFRSLEVDNFKSAREKTKIPLILVFIDNINGMTTSKMTEDYYYKLHTLIKNMSNYGIRFIISCSHLNEVATRIRQEIGDAFALTMKDKYGYQDAIGCRINYIPPSIPGRGLINIQGEALEFQGNIIRPDYCDAERVDYIKNRLKELKEKNQDNVALKLPSFANDETYETFANQFPKRRLPLGYCIDTVKAIALPFKQFHTLTVYFGNKLGIIPILENILLRAEFEGMQITVISRKKDSVFSMETNNTVKSKCLNRIQVIPCEQEAVFEGLRNILIERKRVNHHILEYCKNHEIEPEFNELLQNHSKQMFSYIYDRVEPQLILIESMKDLCDIANDGIIAAIEGLCTVMPLYNMYILSCYEPGNALRVEEHRIHQLLNQEELAVLFGGCYDRQGIVELDYKLKDIKQTIDYNKGLMKYRGEIHSLLMPCGELIKETIDEDDVSIF